MLLLLNNVLEEYSALLTFGALAATLAASE